MLLVARIVGSALVVVSTWTVSTKHVEVPPTTSTTVAEVVATSTTTTSIPPLVPLEVMHKWNKVAWCETHGQWHRAGSRYDGGLGIMPVNWELYGGLQFAPRASMATPEQQVFIAMRIQARNGYEGFVPDQDGRCKGW